MSVGKRLQLPSPDRNSEKDVGSTSLDFYDRPESCVKGICAAFRKLICVQIILARYNYM